MLRSLVIRNHSLIEALDLELERGLTVVTGETGAGKSIVLDALGLALGNRADQRALRVGAERLEVSAGFDVATAPAAAAWLAERELAQDGECWLRRSVARDGRSRAWINGAPVTLAELGTLGGLLVDLHGQHEHHALLARGTQLQLLDEFGAHEPLCAAVRAAHREWQGVRDELAALESSARERAERRQLLEYQIGELAELALAEGEIEQLEIDQRRLANAGEIGNQVAAALSLCADEQRGGALAPLRRAATLVAGLEALGAGAATVRELLESATIQVDEARRELARFGDSIELDPERLAAVERRLDEAVRVARKHRVAPAALPALLTALERECAGLAGADSRIGELQASLLALRGHWQDRAAELSHARRRAADEIGARVADELGRLGMSACRLEVALHPLPGPDPQAGGAEQIEFLVATNPGSAPGPLARIASGGELSRISLAIQVVTASRATTPTVIFDEVDVGIGGATADAVGSLLQTLAARAQVICVTHLPQVAARGHRHLRAAKNSNGEGVSVALVALDPGERIDELSRMLGGRSITARTRAHARELLESAQPA